MSYETERQNITTVFKAAWEAGSDLPVQYENVDFDPPNDAGPFVALAVLRGQSVASGLVGGGTIRYRHPGILQIDVSTAKGKGTALALNYVDEIATIFRGKNISGIVFRAPDVRRMLEPETSRHRFVVSIPFYRDSNL